MQHLSLQSWRQELDSEDEVLVDVEESALVHDQSNGRRRGPGGAAAAGTGAVGVDPALPRLVPQLLANASCRCQKHRRRCAPEDNVQRW